MIIIDNLIEDLQIKRLLREFPENLSGEQQRWLSPNFSRTTKNPFADEPTGS